MELAHHFGELETPYGIDVVLFDSEEFVYRETDRYFLGSELFARQYVGQPRADRYRWGVLLDMVGDANLEIYQERNSVRWRDTRPLVGFDLVGCRTFWEFENSSLGRNTKSGTTISSYTT